MNRVAVAFGFEKLPHRFHLHESEGRLLHLFHVVVEFQGFRLVLGQVLLEVTLVTQVTPEEHIRIDIAP